MMTDNYIKTFIHGLYDGERKKTSKVLSSGCYNKSDTQQRYLSTKPVCFIIYGKPGLPMRDLGNKLANYWKCVHINPHELIEEQINLNSDTGRCMEFNLRCGNIIDADVVHALMTAKIHTDIVKHRGYVLSEVPLISTSEENKSHYGEFYSEYSYLSVENFLNDIINNALMAANLIEELISNVISIDYPNYDTDSSSKVFTNNIDIISFDYSSKFSNIITVVNPRSVDKISDLRNAMTWTVDLEADFVVHLTCPTEDIISVKNKNMTSTPSLLKIKTSMDELNNADSVYGEEETDFTPKEHIREENTENINTHFRLKRPSDFPDMVNSQCELFDTILPAIEKEIKSRECGFGIIMDGRFNIDTLLDKIIICISSLPIYPVLLPERYKNVKTQDSFENLTEDTSTLSPRTFLDSFDKNDSLKSVLSLSESLWASKCPVALSEGKCVTGCVENAVVFLGNIFLLSTSDAADLFCRNPRPYLNCSNLKPTCRIAVLGMEASEKTTLARYLSMLSGGEIITLEDVKNRVMVDKKNEILKKVYPRALLLIAESRRIFWSQEDELRKEKLDLWKNKSLKLIECYFNKQYNRKIYPNNPSVSDFSVSAKNGSNSTSNTNYSKSESKKNIISSDEAQSNVVSNDSLLKSKCINKSQSQLQNIGSGTSTLLSTDSIITDEWLYSEIKKIFRFDVVSLNIVEACKNVLIAPESVLKFAQHSLTTPVELIVPKETDEDVVVLAEKLVDDDDMFDGINITDKEIANKLVFVIKEIEKNWARVNTGMKYGGWIIDSMSLDPNYWDILNKMECLPDDVFSLCDTDDFDRSSFIKYKSRITNFGKSMNNIFETIQNPWDQTSFAELSSRLMVVSNISKIVYDLLENEYFQGLDTHGSSSISVKSSEASTDYILLKKDFDEFNEDWSNLKIFLDDISVQPMELDVNVFDSVSKLFAECFKLLRYRYSVRCKDYKVNDGMSDLSENFNDETADESLSIDLSKLQDSTMFGETNLFCPVVFGKYNVLWRGKREFQTKYKELIYMLSSLSAFEDFKSDPESFLQLEKPIIFNLPPRICITGPKNSASMEVCKLFADKTELLYINFLNFALNFEILPESSDTSLQFYDLLDHSDLNLLKTNENASGYDDETVKSVGDYFTHNHPMPANFLARLIKKLWFTEPFRSQGFILHGFPRLPSDLDVIKEHFAIPDMVIEFRPDLTLANENMINNLFSEWISDQNDRKSKCLIKNQKTIATWKRERESRLIAVTQFRKIFRDALSKCDVDSLRVSITPKSSPGSSFERNSIQTERLQSETSSKSIMKQANSDIVSLSLSEEEWTTYEFEELDNEIPEPVFEEEWESDENAKERISEHVNEWLTSDLEMLKSLKYMIKKDLIPWVGIDDEYSVQRTLRGILKATKDVRNRNQSFFDQTLQIDADSAKKMIKSGLVFVSEFGVDCPVLVYECEFPLPTHYIDVSSNNIFPVLHRSYVYYCSGIDNCRQFCSNPLKYILSFNAEKTVRVPLKVSIVGPPNCGKTTVSRRIEKDSGANVLTRTQSVSFVLENFPWTRLGKKIKEILQNGDVLNKELVIQAVKVAAFDVGEQGFVLDGFPEDEEETLALIALDLFPYVIIDLKCDKNIAIEYLIDDGERNKISDGRYGSAEYLSHVYINWEKSNVEFRKWLEDNYQNLEGIDASNSKWRCWRDAQTIIHARIEDFKCFLHSSCASLKYICITFEEFKQRSSSTKDYCPACLKEGLLRNSNGRLDRNGSVKYKKYFYWFCEKHAEQFITSPYDLDQKLPKHLPEKKSDCLTNESVHENGKCIVTFVSNFPSRKVVQGNSSFSVRYKDKIYLFADEEQQSKFLTEPEKYCNFNIKYKYDELFSMANILNLPNVGYYEQHLCDVVAKAAINTAKMRPKYPGLDARTSASIHMALYLKINDPDATPDDVQHYKNVNEDFEQKCQLVRKTLDVMNNMDNPWLEEHSNHNISPDLLETSHSINE